MICPVRIAALHAPSRQGFFGIMASFFQHFINGITLGGVYALVALGYTMVYGILKFINFAHGDILMWGSYVGLFTYNAIRGSAGPGAFSIFAFFVAMLVSCAFCALLGMSVERVAYKPLRKAERLAPLLSAIGVSYFLSNAAQLLFGTQSRKMDYPFDNSPISFLSVSITPHQLMVLAVSAASMAFLIFFINKTKTGKAIRATSLDQDAAALMGINPDRIISVTFAIGSVFAAIAGMLVSLDIKIYATMGMMLGMKAFVAAVVGGIGDIAGAVLGGIMLGLLETFGIAVLHIPVGYKDSIAFVVLILILIVKPSGILGKNIREKV